MMDQKQQQAQRQQQMQKYVQTVLTALEGDPESLSGTEKRFGTKYVEAQQRVRQVENDLTQLREQVRQSEARIKTLELQHQMEAGRAGALLESLVSLKFEVDDPPSAPVVEGASPGDNGAQKPPLKEAVSPVAQA